MSKTKNKTHSETDHLRGQIKKLKSENRALSRRNRELEKKSHFYEDVVEESVEETEFKELCPACKKGQIIEYNFIHVIVKKCSECDYKKTRKPGK